jgi:hypothetical protein
MLTISECSRGLNRRAFLTIGSLGLGGLSLSSLLGARAIAGETASLATGKSVIFLFQQGGPSQFETFDPKMDAPDGIRTVTGSVQTSIPGVHFGDTMSKLAKLADKLTIVRSFQTNNGGHNLQPIVSPDTLNANMGSLYSRVVGATRATNGMPTNAVVFPDSVCSDVLKGKARGDISATGSLGADNAPFIPGAGGQLQKNLRLSLSKDRLEDRQLLVEELNRLNQKIATADDQKLVDDLQKQAYQVLLSGGVADALDLTKEDAATIARYDTNAYTRPDGWNKVNRGKQGMYTGHAKAIGKQLLLARRLCEAGCGFVTIHAGYDGVWDMHADGNNLNMKDGMEAVGHAFDHAVAAFVEDLEARGLRDKILLVCCGEMGRTPRLNKKGGRDHWGKLSPLLMYGGGIPGGQVIGRSNRDGGEPAADPLTPKHLISTILHALFDVGRLRVASSLSQVAKLAEHAVIPGGGVKNMGLGMSEKKQSREWQPRRNRD